MVLRCSQEYKRRRFVNIGKVLNLAYRPDMASGHKEGGHLAAMIIVATLNGFAWSPEGPIRKLFADIDKSTIFLQGQNDACFYCALHNS